MHSTTKDERKQKKYTSSDTKNIYLKVNLPSATSRRCLGQLLRLAAFSRGESLTLVLFVSQKSRSRHVGHHILHANHPEMNNY